MKENNKKNLIIVVAVLLVVAITVLVVLNLEDKEVKIFEPEGNVDIVASLSGESQNEIDTQIKEDLKENKYKLANAKVYINPYGKTPLSALIVFASDKETDVTVTVKGKNGDDLVLKSGKAKEHFVPVYGLYAGYENTVEVTLGTGEKKTVTIKTDDIEGKPNSTVNLANASNDGIYFLTSPLAMTSFAVDGHGEVRWVVDDLYYHSIEVLENGHILIGTDKVNDDSQYTKIIEIDYLGRLYNEYEIEDGYLNAFFLKEDGNLIIPSKKSDRKTYSDYIIEVDRSTGKIVKTWDVLETILQVDENYKSKITSDNYFYNSGVEYYPESDSLVLTYWGGEFVINLSYEDGSIKWIFSNPDNFTEKFDSLLLKGGDGFVYPKSMHSASLEKDILKVFDNGYSMNSGESDTSKLTGAYSSANTYKIDNKNISLTSSVDGDKKLFSYALGDYNVLSKTNEIILFGRELKGLNRARSGNINNYEHLYSKIIERKDGNVVLDMDIDWGTQTVDKINFDKCEFSFDLPNSYTTMEPATKENITDDVMKLLTEAEEDVPYEFGYSKGVIEHNVLFMNGDEAKVILVNDEKIGTMYTIKEKGKKAKMRLMTDLDKDKYYVYVLENGVVYKTDKFIEIK